MYVFGIGGLLLPQGLRHLPKWPRGLHGRYMNLLHGIFNHIGLRAYFMVYEPTSFTSIIWYLSGLGLIGLNFILLDVFIINFVRS